MPKAPENLLRNKALRLWAKGAILFYILITLIKLLLMRIVNNTDATFFAGIVKIWYIKDDGYRFESIIRQNSIFQLRLDMLALLIRIPVLVFELLKDVLIASEHKEFILSMAIFLGLLAWVVRSTSTKITTQTEEAYSNF